MIPLHVLLIEDSELDAGLILRQLYEAGYAITSGRVEDESQLIEALKNQWDIIIADFMLPEFNATEALKIVLDSGIDTPFIIVSGAIGEETAVALMKAGARDYLMKDKLSRLPPVVERELLEFNIRRSQKQAHEALLQSERNLKNSQRVAHIAHWVMCPSTDESGWSDEMYRILGLDAATCGTNLKEIWLGSLHPDDRARFSAQVVHADLKTLNGEMEYRIIRPDGSIRYILGQMGEVIQDTSGRENFTGVVHDITERKLIELDLLEKMEESQNRARELEAITFVSSRMRQAKSHNELVIIVLQELAKLLDASRATLAFIEGDKFYFEYLVSDGQLLSINKSGKIGKGLRNIIHSGALGFFQTIPPEIIHEMQNWISGKTPPPSSLIIYPIMKETQTVGLIYLDFKTPTTFNHEQRNIVETVAEMAGNAINRMLATQELEYMVEQRERELESIYKVTSSASGSLDIDQALQQALLLTLEAVHSSSGAILLLDESESILNLIASKIGEDIPHDIFHQNVIKKHLNRILEQRKAIVVPNLHIAQDTQNKNHAQPGLSFVGLPMRSQDQVVGVLAVVNKSDEQVVLQEMTLLSFIADHLALAVENTRLHKKAERSAVMEERSRLARELHDSVTQSLYSASLYSAGARRFYSQGKYPEVDSYLTQIGDLTQQALKDMRLLVYELRSPELKRNGLVGALQNRLDAVERRLNIEADIHEEDIGPLSEEIEENLYRIAMESLNNSLKYAQATRISLSFIKDGSERIFSVQDNGMGFLVDKGLQSGGMGLATMRERTERIGGRFKILSLPEKGTTIEVRFSIVENLGG